jgi:hypothetical protein
VTVNILEDQNSPTGSTITLQFRTNKSNKNAYVIFTQGESIDCNGITTMLRSAASYSVRMEIPPVYECEYLIPYLKYPMIVVRAKRLLSPVLLFPVNKKSLRIGYNSDASSPACVITVVAKDHSRTIYGNTVPEKGNTYIGPDVSSLHGPGKLVMTRTCTQTTYSSLDFASVEVRYQSTATISVTW